jgi:predicted dehydrogenase
MTSALSVGIIVGGDHGAELIAHGAPYQDIAIKACAAVGDEALRQARSLADHFAVPLLAGWQAMVSDPAVPAIVILADLPHRGEIAAAALQAGKTVLCAFPPAIDPASLSVLVRAKGSGGGRLMTYGAIVDSAAGTDALQALHDGRLGKLHSLWAAARVPRHAGDAGGVLDQLGWQMIEFVLAAIESPIMRVHVEAATLFDPRSNTDTVVALLRFADDVVCTIELSRCLPESVPSGAMGEVEIEAIGARGVVRIEPGRSVVQIHGGRGITMRPMGEAALIRALSKLPSAVRSDGSAGDYFERSRRAIALMDSLQAGPRSVQS